ncbi:MAG: hypothetical protein QM601_07435, partial [Pseudoxanthomonas sp.]
SASSGPTASRPAPRADAGRLPVAAPLRAAFAPRLAHARARMQLPAALAPRLRVVLAETLSGRYWRYSAGLRSVVSDLFGLSR